MNRILLKKQSIDLHGRRGKLTSKTKEDLELVKKFITEVLLDLAPGIYAKIMVGLKNLSLQLLEDPRRAYSFLVQIFDGEESLAFFDRIVAFHIESKTGISPPDGKVFRLLREGSLVEFLRIARAYIKAIS